MSDQQTGRNDSVSTPPQLRTAVFRQEWEGSWERLEALLERRNRGGRHALSSDELLELPQLYRATLSSLSVSRNYVMDGQLTAYLEALALRAHIALFRSQESVLQATGRIVARDLPRSCRLLAGPILLAAIVFLAGALIGYFITHHRPDLFFNMIPSDLVSGRTPFATPEHLHKSLYPAEIRTVDLTALALHLVQNNIGVSLIMIAFGLAFGVPTALLLFYNGSIVGAFCSVFFSQGMGLEFLAWLSVHGTTELTAIIFAGGVGFAIAGAILFPPPRTKRLTSALRVGPHAARIALAVVFMLAVAAILEGFTRQLVAAPVERLLVGTAMAGLWALYFAGTGRRRDAEAPRNRP